MPGFFKGKSVNYHTEIKTTKGEQVVIWVTAFLFLAFVVFSIMLFESVWLMVLCDFIAFGIMFGIWLAIIFSPRHKEEREENTSISKS